MCAQSIRDVSAILCLSRPFAFRSVGANGFDAFLGRLATAGAATVGVGG